MEVAFALPISERKAPLPTVSLWKRVWQMDTIFIVEALGVG
jgi:hypothetical protein